MVRVARDARGTWTEEERGGGYPWTVLGAKNENEEKTTALVYRLRVLETHFEVSFGRRSESDGESWDPVTMTFEHVLPLSSYVEMHVPHQYSFAFVHPNGTEATSAARATSSAPSFDLGHTGGAGRTGRTGGTGGTGGAGGPEAKATSRASGMPPLPQRWGHSGGAGGSFAAAALSKVTSKVVGPVAMPQSIKIKK